jgi:hypothetical protein
MTRLLLLADTHVPARARALSAQVWGAIESADLVIHAGDWIEPELLDQMQDRAARLVGVWGNNDPAELRVRLPEIARVKVAGVRIAVVHETGPARGREARSDELFPDADVLVFGHSHIPWDSVTPGGLRLLNPGSPTDRRRMPTCTYMTAGADAGALREVRVVDTAR